MGSPCMAAKCKMSRYQYILLDWDGNIAKTLDIWLDAFKQPLVKRGIRQSDGQIAASFGVFNEYMATLGVTDPDEVMKEADAIAKRTLINVDLYPNTVEVLHQLRTIGKHTALITSSPSKNVLPILEKHSMTHLFDAIVTHEDTVKHKPHAEPLEKALQLIGGDHANAIMIGDSDKDVSAAVNAGIDSVLFYPKEHEKFYDLSQLRKLNPTYTISDFREIMDIVQ